MLTFKFDISDVKENECYHSVEMRWADTSSDCIEDMVEHFEDFLIGLGYGVEHGEIQFVKGDDI